MATLSVKFCMAFIRLCRSQNSVVCSDAESTRAGADEISVRLFFSFWLCSILGHLVYDSAFKALIWELHTRTWVPGNYDDNDDDYDDESEYVCYFK